MSLRRPIRILVPVLLILCWVAGAGIGGPYFGRVAEVSSNDQAQFLPDSAEATQVSERFTDFVGDDAIPAVVIITGTDAIDKPQLAAIDEELSSLAELEGVFEVSPLLPSEDGLAAQGFVAVSSQADVADTVEAIRGTLRETLPEGVSANVTGPAGFSADLVAAFAGIDGLLLVVTLVAVLIILLLVYRAVLLPFVVLRRAFSPCAWRC